MRYLITWDVHHSGEADLTRILTLFAKWQPPTEMHEFHGFADGSGGMAIVETDDVNVLGGVTGAVSPWLKFSIRALLPIEQNVVMMSEGAAFRAAN